MSVEERVIEVTTYDVCKSELTSDYIHVKNAELSTPSLEDKHFCNRTCLKNFIEVYV